MFHNIHLHLHSIVVYMELVTSIPYRLQNMYVLIYACISLYLVIYIVLSFTQIYVLKDTLHTFCQNLKIENSRLSGKGKDERVILITIYLSDQGIIRRKFDKSKLRRRVSDATRKMAEEPISQSYIENLQQQQVMQQQQQQQQAMWLQQQQQQMPPLLQMPPISISMQQQKSAEE